MSIRILTGDVFERLAELPDESVDCVVTSPPYWGLRCYGVDGQIGLEPTLGEHIDVMVRVFEEVRRVLKPTGTVWLNYGDCYATAPNGRSAAATKDLGNDDRTFRDKPFSTVQGNLKSKDLCMISNRLAIALQDAGWWVRSEIVWTKPNPMPESITDRPTSSHEKIWLLTKEAKYFYDAEAVREPMTRGTNDRGTKRNPPCNLRNVWTIATAPFPEAHFATFPPAIPERCIKAGSSERGCCAACGAPWVRMIERQYVPANHGGTSLGTISSGPKQDMREDQERCAPGYREKLTSQTKTTGWSPSCQCNAETVPAVILDPFGGSGTTGLVADRLGRDAILIELNPEYAAMAERRIKQDAPMFTEVTA